MTKDKYCSDDKLHNYIMMVFTTNTLEDHSFLDYNTGSNQFK